MGSTAAAIFWQFITETACITLFAVALAFGWSWLAMSALNEWLHFSLTLNPLGITADGCSFSLWSLFIWDRLLRGI